MFIFILNEAVDLQDQLFHPLERQPQWTDIVELSTKHPDPGLAATGFRLTYQTTRF